MTLPASAGHGGVHVVGRVVGVGHVDVGQVVVVIVVVVVVVIVVVVNVVGGVDDRIHHSNGKTINNFFNSICTLYLYGQ